VADARLNIEKEKFHEKNTHAAKKVDEKNNVFYNRRRK
jgi:hypothetical protein